MKGAGSLLCLGLALSGSLTPQAAPAPVTAHSRSGQFTVHGLPQPFLADAVTNTTLPAGFVRLDPNLLAVSAERVKEALLRELDARDAWRGRVLISLREPGGAGELPRLNSTLFANGWQYQLELPSSMEKSKLLQTLTHALLLELAQRDPGSRQAELPAWLIEGFAAYLLAADGPGLIVEPNLQRPLADTGWLIGKGTYRNERVADRLSATRAALVERAPLTFTDLSWPTAEFLVVPSNRQLYQSCSLLLLHELLHLDHGRAALRQMLPLLPQHLNWQMAFLQAFSAHFSRLLDVEKWWALGLAQLTGRPEAMGWSQITSLDRLAEMLPTTVQMRISSNTLPVRAEVSLQHLLREWRFAEQKPVLQTKITQIQTLRIYVQPSLVPLVDAYQECLATYLDQHGRAGLIPPLRGPPQIRLDHLTADTIRRLDDLDRRRRILTAGAATNTPVQPPPRKPDA